MRVRSDGSDLWIVVGIVSEERVPMLGFFFLDICLCCSVFCKTKSVLD